MQGLKALLTTLIISLPAFYNVGALLMLVFFMYSYVAVLIFGSIQPQAAINDHANFSNFGKQQHISNSLQHVWVDVLVCHVMQGNPVGCQRMIVLSAGAKLVLYNETGIRMQHVLRTVCLGCSEPPVCK